MNLELKESYFDNIFEEFSKILKDIGAVLPAVSFEAIDKKDPFCVLISTILSLRTKDNVTLDASERLFQMADNPKDMLLHSEQEISDIIFPVGFYKTKAKRIREISRILIDDFNGHVPSDSKSLLSLPGVGIKPANLTLNLGFDIPAICVDCHVHVISNRLGWIRTKTPEESEKALMKILPKKYWISLNELLVSYGQNICTTVSPKCSICPENMTCSKIGVKHSR